MKQDPEALASALHTKATLLLERSGLLTLFNGYGKVHLTGSYALDLMATRDLEAELVLFEMWDPLDAFFALGHQIAKQPGVFGMTFTNYLRKPAPHLPAGLHWAVRMVDSENDAQWKINIWAVDEAHAQREEGLMTRIRSTLDDESRRLILRMKHAFLTEENRTPSLNSLPLYEAVLFEGLRDEAAIRAYLGQHGVQGV